MDQANSNNPAEKRTDDAASVTSAVSPVATTPSDLANTTFKDNFDQSSSALLKKLSESNAATDKLRLGVASMVLRDIVELIEERSAKGLDLIKLKEVIDIASKFFGPQGEFTKLVVSFGKSLQSTPGDLTGIARDMRLACDPHVPKHTDTKKDYTKISDFLKDHAGAAIKEILQSKTQKVQDAWVGNKNFESRLEFLEIEGNEKKGIKEERRVIQTFTRKGHPEQFFSIELCRTDNFYEADFLHDFEAINDPEHVSKTDSDPEDASEITLFEGKDKLVPASGSSILSYVLNRHNGVKVAVISGLTVQGEKDVDLWGEADLTEVKISKSSLRSLSLKRLDKAVIDDCTLNEVLLGEMNDAEVKKTTIRECEFKGKQRGIKLIDTVIKDSEAIEADFSNGKIDGQTRFIRCKLGKRIEDGHEEHHYKGANFDGLIIEKPALRVSDILLRLRNPFKMELTPKQFIDCEVQGISTTPRTQWQAITQEQLTSGRFMGIESALRQHFSTGSRSRFRLLDRNAGIFDICGNGFTKQQFNESLGYRGQTKEEKLSNKRVTEISKQVDLLVGRLKSSGFTIETITKSPIETDKSIFGEYFKSDKKYQEYLITCPNNKQLVLVTFGRQVLVADLNAPHDKAMRDHENEVAAEKVKAEKEKRSEKMIEAPKPFNIEEEIKELTKESKEGFTTSKYLIAPPRREPTKEEGKEKYVYNGLGKWTIANWNTANGSGSLWTVSSVETFIRRRGADQVEYPEKS